MLDGMSQSSGPVNVTTGAGGRAFRVLAQARTAQGAVFVREAVVEFVAAQPGAYAFRRWRKGLATDSGTEAPAAEDLPPC